jgi:hypothetical protein
MIRYKGSLENGGMRQMKAMCLWCQVEFYPNRDWQRFCCTEHQQAWHRHERKLSAVRAAEMARQNPRLAAAAREAARKLKPTEPLERKPNGFTRRI